MAKSFLLSARIAGIGFTDNNTLFTSLGGRLLGPAGSDAVTQVNVRDAGVFSNLYARVLTNTASVTSTITFRDSGADTSLTVSYTSDQTGIKEDTTNTATLTATDEACWEVTVPSEAGTNTMTIGALACEFTPTTTTDCVTFFQDLGGAAATASTSSFWFPVGHGFVDGGAESGGTSYTVTGSFVAQYLGANVSSNTRTTDTTIRTRVNQNNGNQLITYSSGQTGRKEDASNTDSLVSGDDYGYVCTTSTNTGTCTFNTTLSNLVSTNNEFILTGGGGVAVGPSTTNYVYIGATSQGTTTESVAQVYPRFNFTLKNLGCYVSTNTNAASSCDVFVRDNGGDSAMTVSYAATQTGYKEDLTNTASITSGTDEMNYSVVNNDGAGTCTVSWLASIGFTETVSSVYIGNQFYQLLGVGT